MRNCPELFHLVVQLTENRFAPYDADANGSWLSLQTRILRMAGKGRV
jgi:hypothetical protein